MPAALLAETDRLHEIDADMADTIPAARHHRAGDGRLRAHASCEIDDDVRGIDLRDELTNRPGAFNAFGECGPDDRVGGADIRTVTRDFRRGHTMDDGSTTASMTAAAA